MNTGTVKFFNLDRGFGFIVDDESKQDVFVHQNGLLNKIGDGDLVEFTLEKGPKGLHAVNVKSA